MTPEQKARISIDKKLEQSGWMVQDVKRLNPMAYSSKKTTAKIRRNPIGNH